MIDKSIQTVEQKNIFDLYQNTNNHILIEALAGTGKSTVLKHLSSLENKKILYLAFNKFIKNSLKEDINNNKIDIHNFHSFSYKNLCEFYNKKKININPYKVVNIYEKLINKKVIFNDELTYNEVTLVALAKCNMVRNIFDLQRIANKYNLDKCDIDLAFKMFTISKNQKTEFDLNDIIYITANDRKFIRQKYEIIFVDECQDLNKAQHSIITNTLLSDGRIVAVGDRNQAIYGFQGSDEKSFDYFNNFPHIEIMPLTINFRCSTSVIKEAQKLVPQIQHKPNAIAGEVKRISSDEIPLNSTILCRNIKPLYELGLFLYEKNIDFKVTSDDLKKKFNEISEDSSFGNKLLMNNNKKDIINLTTIHQSKGLEFQNVVLYQENLIPSPIAVNQWQKEQEYNLKYVAITRAKHNFFYLEKL